MKIRSGNIPKELTYIFSSPQSLKISWEDVEEEEGDTVKMETVHPTFVSDSTNEGTLSTGRNWAKHRGNAQTWDPATGKWTKAQNHPVQEVTRKNEPITKLRIFGIDYRYNGGRAWKCADKDGYYFDLREDVLLDLMRTAGVSEGGYLNGEYIWAKVAQEMKLVRVGSELHAALIESTERREMKLISKKEYEPFHVYQKKTGERYLYIGHCQHFATNLPKYAKDDERTDRWYRWSNGMNDKNSWIGQDYFRKYRSWDEPQRPVRMEVAFKAEREHVFIPLDGVWNDKKSAEENVKALQAKGKKFLESVISKNRYGNIGANNAPSSYALTSSVDFSSSLKFVNDLGVINIPSIYEQIREETLEYILKWQAWMATAPKQPGQNSNHIMAERSRVRGVANMISWGTIHPKTDDFDPSHDDWVTMLISKEPT